MHLKQPLSWSSVPGATGYQLQISTNNLFSTTLVNLPYTRETTYLTDELAAGTYYWRVRAVTLDSVGSWSETRSFSLQADWEQDEYPPVPEEYPTCTPVLRRG